MTLYVSVEMYHLVQRNGAIGKGNESKNRTQSIEPIIHKPMFRKRGPDETYATVLFFCL